MPETYLRLDDEVIFVRHSTLRSGCPSALLIHGLGASGLCYADAFERDELQDVNLIAADLVGFGRSSASPSNDYRFERQIERLWSVVQHLDASGPLVVVGHSMGGDIGTLMCAGDEQARISQFISVEGNLTRADMTISGAALRAERRGRFGDWLRKDFAERFVYEQLGQSNPALRSYYASLGYARPEAFVASCQQIDHHNAEVQQSLGSRIGDLYCSLQQPKLFCHGTKSLSRSTARLLQERGVEARAFEDAGHFVMGEKPELFYPLLAERCHR